MPNPGMVNESFVQIDNGPEKKTKTKNQKAREILKKALRECTEFSLRVAETPNGVMVVAFVAHLPAEAKEELGDYAR